ncbi:type I-E CRISPR-associated protein Cas7/Cse4/CasC [bacterium]|nr:type I-E CRISPR-associated protein Cas7/Cse4/CasC [bacterium]
MSRFIQIHWLASYPAALLNRDDAGQAKRMPFGGSVRGRVSSQCLKRHWRLAGAPSLDRATENPHSLQALGADTGHRSREVVERLIMPAVREQHPDLDDEAAEGIQLALIEQVYGNKAGDPKKRQALLIGDGEVRYLTGKALEALASGEPDAKKALTAALKGEKKNIKALVGGAGLEAALFGRMVTSDTSANTDAAIHVAHALTVHALERETDFMSVVDDLKTNADGDDSGAAGVFDMELASGLYYGYTVIDVPLLIANLTSDVGLPARVAEHLLYLIAEVSPGAKKGSTAPYAFAEWMLVEAGDRQPRTLANAFRKALDGREITVEEAVARLDAHLAKLDATYGEGERRRQMGLDSQAGAGGDALALNALASWAGEQVQARADAKATA